MVIENVYTKQDIKEWLESNQRTFDRLEKRGKISPNSNKVIQETINTLKEDMVNLK